MFTTGKTVCLAEWIIDDTCLVTISSYFFPSSDDSLTQSSLELKLDVPRIAEKAFKSRKKTSS